MNQVSEEYFFQIFKTVRNWQRLVLGPGETSKTMKFNQAEGFLQIIPVAKVNYQEGSYQILMEGTVVETRRIIEDRYINGAKFREENGENGTYQIKNLGNEEILFLILAIKKDKGK